MCVYTLAEVPYPNLDHRELFDIAPGLGHRQIELPRIHWPLCCPPRLASSLLARPGHWWQTMFQKPRPLPLGSACSSSDFDVVSTNRRMSLGSPHVSADKARLCLAMHHPDFGLAPGAGISPAETFPRSLLPATPLYHVSASPEEHRSTAIAAEAKNAGESS